MHHFEEETVLPSIKRIAIVTVIHCQKVKAIDGISNPAAMLSIQARRQVIAASHTSAPKAVPKAVANSVIAGSGTFAGVVMVAQERKHHPTG